MPGHKMRKILDAYEVAIFVQDYAIKSVQGCVNFLTEFALAKQANTFAVNGWKCALGSSNEIDELRSIFGKRILFQRCEGAARR